MSLFMFEVYNYNIFELIVVLHSGGNININTCSTD